MCNKISLFNVFPFNIKILESYIALGDRAASHVKSYLEKLERYIVQSCDVRVD